MTNDFSERLDAARKAGKQAVKRDGQTVKALTFKAMDAGEDEPIEVLVKVLEERGEMPEWLRDAPRHELGRVLSTWGSARHAMREHRKAKP